jgi:hypothetical protein
VKEKLHDVVPLRVQKPTTAEKGKKLRPVGVCKTCGGLTYRTESINDRCGRSPHGHRCTGTFSNASREIDWKECVSCHATGKLGSAACIYCRGIGWSLAKPWVL